MSIVKLDKINKSYDHRTILEDLDLTVDAGEMVAIMGPSGSGKSTILNIIGLLENPDSGQLYLFDQPSPKIHSHQAVLARRHQINYIFQTHALISNLSVENNLLLAMKSIKIKTSSKLHQIKGLLDRFNLSEISQSKVSSLSSGEAQRVAIIRSILKPGQLILADEPTGSLDQDMAKITFDMIRQLRDDYDKTVLLVTHDPAIGQACDRIIKLT